MIYTKGKAGYHMEKSDILTASLPDANAMPLSQLFEVLFDSSVVVKYPIF